MGKYSIHRRFARCVVTIGTSFGTSRLYATAAAWRLAPTFELTLVALDTRQWWTSSLDPRLDHTLRIHRKRVLIIHSGLLRRYRKDLAALKMYAWFRDGSSAISAN